MPGEDSASRKRGRIERRGDALRVRVYAGADPVTGRRVYCSETIPRTDRAAQRRAEKTLTRLLAEVDAQRAPTSTVTPAYVLAEWLRSVELEDMTRRTYMATSTERSSRAFGSIAASKLSALVQRGGCEPPRPASHLHT